MRDLSKVGELLDKSVTLGVNEGGGLTFINDDTSVMMTKARRRAVAEALSKAKTLAEAADVKLGPVIDISESLMRPSRHWNDFERFSHVVQASASSVPVEVGENTFRVQVNISFELD